jgi:hypothetical protein
MTRRDLAIVALFVGTALILGVALVIIQVYL